MSLSRRLPVLSLLCFVFVMGGSISARADVHTVRVNEFYTQCTDGSTGIQYIELRPLTTGQFFRQCTSIQIRRTVGGPDLFFAKPVFVGHTDGESFLATKTFLLGTPAFQAATGIVPDLLIPNGTLDKAGGVIRLAADSGCEPNTNWGTIHEVRYGDQGTAPAPGPDQAAVFQAGTGLFVIGSTTPKNFAGNTVSDWMCPSAGDTTPPTVHIVSPNGGENWPVGSVQPITWMATDDVGVDHFDLYYSVDAGANWNPIALGTPNDGSFDWMVPPADTSGMSSALIRGVATDAAMNAGEDVSDAPFTIFGQSASPFPNGVPRPTVLQNRPNPFNPGTFIGFALPEAGHVRIDIYAITGRHVRTLLESERNSGYGEVFWDGTDDGGLPASSGVYLYTFRSGPVREVRRMILSK